MHRSPVRARAASTVTAALLGVSVLVGPSVPTALADPTIATSLNVWGIELNPKPVGRATELVAFVQPATVALTGTLTVYDDDGATRTLIDSKPVAVDGPTGGLGARFPLAADMPEGTYHLVVAYSGNATYLPSESEPQTFTVGPRPTDVNVKLASTYDGSGATAQKGDSVYVDAFVADAGVYTPDPIAITGDVTIEVDGVVKATIAPNAEVELSTATWTLGTHVIKATYPGDGVDYSGSTGSKSITILAGVINATNVGVAWATFYPYKDGYRDTVAIRGNRAEPISAAIRVYSPTNALVRTFAVPSGTGTYSVAWNGRTAAGTALPAGKYKVVQTLTDGAVSKVFTNYTTISPKRIYTYTKTLTKDYAHRAAQGTSSVAWEFTLPAATVYKKLVFGVYAKSSPAGAFGPHDFSYCAKSVWDVGCGYPGAPIGASLAWRNVTGSVTYSRSGTYVRLYAIASVRSNLKSGRVTVTYGLLK